MTRVISLANEKGGVAKTTTVLELSTALGRLGRRVLTIDFCPGFHLTRRFGIAPSTAPGTALDVAGSLMALPDAVIREIIPGVDLLAGSPSLDEFQLTLTSQMSREEFLVDALEGHLDAYEFVLIDTPPNLDMLTVNALFASQEVIVPIDMLEEGALQGAAKAIATTRRIARKRPLEVLAGLRVCVDHRSDGYKGMSPALAELGIPLFATEIPDTRAFSNAARRRMPLLKHKAAHPGAIAYTELAIEFLNGVGYAPGKHQKVA
jgi:chromosome partitioning protein